ncbi:MAG: DUF1570 domain-containing protein, partial [Algisphaera sp.]
MSLLRFFRRLAPPWRRAPITRLNACLSACLSITAIIGHAPNALGADDLHAFASAHYNIHTDLSRRQTVPFGRHMDLLFGQYERRFRQFGETGPNPFPLYLLSNEPRYHRFMRSAGIAAENSGGMFFVLPKRHGLATWTHGRSRSQTRRILQHEGFHQFAFEHFGQRLPAWMNEGLAQYFEDAVLLDRGFELGLADPDRIERVRQSITNGSALPLASLMKLASKDWHHTLTTNDSRAGLLYAQSWSLVYFLIHGNHGMYQVSFENYLRYLGEGIDADNAFRRAFGTNAVPAIENHWRRWARTQLPDAVTVAAARMTFLGEALAYKSSRKEKQPKNLKQLQADLQQRGFAITRTVHELDLELRADQPELYTYTRPGGEVSKFL